MTDSDDIKTSITNVAPPESEWRVTPDSRPSDYIYALISRHVYQGKALEIGDSLPNDVNWKIVATKSGGSGYFGALYFNQRDHHYVLAHRGTNSLPAWIEDFQGIYLGQISPQKQAAYDFVKETVAIISKSTVPGAGLSFTGHSLGAFLAELSVFYCHRSLDFHNVNAVTFESPGSYETLASMQTQVKGAEIELHQLDIIGYLSYPNLINTCNHHVGTLYQLDPNLGNWGWISGWFTRQAHSMDGIVEIFGEESRPVTAKYLLDWPMGDQLRIFYTDARFQEGKYLQELVDSEGHRLFKLEYQAHYSIDQALSRSNVLPIRHFNTQLRNFLLIFDQWKRDSRMIKNSSFVDEKLRTIKPELFRKYLADYTLIAKSLSIKKDVAVMLILDKETQSVTDFRRDISQWLSSKTKEDELIALMRQNITTAPTLEIISILVGEGARVESLKNSTAIAAKVTIPQDASTQDIKNAQELIQQFQQGGGKIEAIAFAPGSVVGNAENVETRALDIEISQRQEDVQPDIKKKVNAVSSKTDISATAFSGIAHTVTSPVAIGSLHGNFYLNTGPSQHSNGAYRSLEEGTVSILQDQLKTWLGDVITKNPAFEFNKFLQFNLKINERSLSSTLFAEREHASLSVEPTNLITYRLPVRVEGDLYKLEITGFRSLLNGIPKFQHCGRVISEKAIVQVKLQLNSSNYSLQLVSVSIQEINELFSGIGAESQLGRVRALSDDIRPALDQQLLSDTLKAILSADRAPSPEDKKTPGPRNRNLNQVVGYFKPKRQDELQQRIMLLKQDNPGLVMCAITGVAGCGKSELAKAYAWQFSTMPDSFVWRLDSDPDTSNNIASQVSYRQAYDQLLDNFNLHVLKPYDFETPKMFKQRRDSILWNTIIQYDSWILIFDNAGSYTDVAGYLPPDSIVRGLVLITTQQSHFLKDNKEANFSLNQGLDPTEAVHLLEEVSHRSSENKASSQDLVQELDYSPLGIRIAGVYIHNTDMTFERYARVLKRGTQEKLVQNLGGVDFINQATQDKKRTTTLEMALQLSIERVQGSGEDPLLIKVLQYCGYLGNENIPLDLLTALCQAPEQNQLDVEDKLRTTIVGKGNYSLLTYQSHSKTCYLHRTTQLVLRSVTSDLAKIIQEATSVILKLYPYEEYSDASIKKCSRVSDHMLALSQHAKLHSIPVKIRISLLLTLGQVYHRFSRYKIGYQCLTESLGLVNESMQLGDPNEKVLILKVMASYKYDLEKFEEAIGLLNQALHLATDPVLIGGIYNDLAKNYRVVHRERVLKAYQDALKACEPVSPKSKQCCLTMADSHVGIGLCLEDGNDRVRALDQHKQALGIYESSLEGQNLCTAITYTNIGKLGLVGLDPNDDQIYKFKNFGISQEDSTNYLLRALKTKIEIYGPKIRSVAISYEWLGHMILVSGQWKEALDYFQRAIDIYEDLLENGSDRELNSYNGKAMALEKSKDSKHLRLAVEIYNKIWQATKPPSIRTKLHERASERLRHLELAPQRYYKDDQPALNDTAGTSSALQDVEIYTARKSRLHILQSLDSYLSCFSDLNSAAVVYTLDSGSESSQSRPIILLYSHQHHQLSQQIQQHPYGGSPTPIQGLEICQPGVSHLIPPNSPTPILSHDQHQDLFPAYQKAIQTLFSQHSNITMITIGYGYSSSKSPAVWDATPRILVYVYKKRFIPWGEKPIPKQIMDRRTRVMEGICVPHVKNRPLGVYQHIDPIAPGASIGLSTGEGSGTIGAFLTDEKETYLLTNDHVVTRGSCYFHRSPDPQCIKVQQPSMPDWKTHNEDSPQMDLTIGEVINAKKFRGNSHYGKVSSSCYAKEGVGLDVALCQCSTNRQISGRDPALQDYDYSSQVYGFSERLPLNMKIIKNGRTSGLTTGQVLSEASVAYHPILGDFLYKASCGFGCQCDPPMNAHTDCVILHNQYVVEGDDDPFSKVGDSGSLCYLLEDHKIRPFGLLHSGVAKSFKSIVTPLEAVMEFLGDYRIIAP